MAYDIILTRRARRSFRRLDPNIQRRIARAIDGLADVPRPVRSRKMTGADALYRIRVGDYRVVYEVRDQELIVLVLNIDHRKDVYR